MSTHKSRKASPILFVHARRRYFLKNHGPLYAAMADLARIVGLALWRMRYLLTKKQDDTSPISTLRFGQT